MKVETFIVMRHYITKLGAVSLLVSGVLFAILQMEGQQLLHEKVLWFQLFFVVFTYMSHRLSNIFLENHSEHYHLFYLASMTFRVLFTLSTVLVGLVMGIEQPEQFALNIVGLYLFYTVFEISAVLTNLQTETKLVVAK